MAIAFSVLGILVGVAVFAYVRVSQERAKAATARDRLQKEADKSSAVRRVMREVFRHSHPLGIGTMRSLDEVVKSVATEYADQPQVEAAARTAIGQVYWFLGKVEEAETQFVAALEILEDNFGEEHPDRLDPLMYLGYALWQRRDYHGAEEATRRILDLRRRFQPAHC